MNEWGFIGYESLEALAKSATRINLNQGVALRS